MVYAGVSANRISRFRDPFTISISARCCATTCKECTVRFSAHPPFPSLSHPYPSPRSLVPGPPVPTPPSLSRVPLKNSATSRGAQRRKKRGRAAAGMRVREGGREGGEGGRGGMGKYSKFINHNFSLPGTQKRARCIIYRYVLK